MSTNAISEKVIKELNALGGWYQKMDIHGVPTLKDGQPYSGNISSSKILKIVKSFMPSSLNGMRVLDLGSNAGFFSLNMSMMGASEVIGVEMNDVFFNQSLYLKKHFEELNGGELNVKFIQKNISDLNFNEFGKFDYVLALSIIYHIGKHKYGKYTEGALNEQIRVLKEISHNTKYFIVGTRNGEKNNVNHYDKVFSELNFVRIKAIITGKKRSWALYSGGNDA